MKFNVEDNTPSSLLKLLKSSGLSGNNLMIKNNKKYAENGDNPL